MPFAFTLSRRKERERERAQASGAKGDSLSRRHHGATPFRQGLTPRPAWRLRGLPGRLPVLSLAPCALSRSLCSLSPSLTWTPSRVPWAACCCVGCSYAHNGSASAVLWRTASAHRAIDSFVPSEGGRQLVPSVSAHGVHRDCPVSVSTHGRDSRGRDNHSLIPPPLLPSPHSLSALPPPLSLSVSRAGQSRTLVSKGQSTALSRLNADTSFGLLQGFVGSGVFVRLPLRVTMPSGTEVTELTKSSV